IIGVELPLAPILDRPRLALLSGEEDEIYTSSDRPAGFKYTVRSATADPPVGALARIADGEPPPALARYLQLPPGRSPRLRQLAFHVTQGARGPYAKAMAIREHLQRNYRYTTDLRAPRTGDPLAEFLFDTQAGHCEYFATAMAILLRSVGIPTREVNG